MIEAQGGDTCGNSGTGETPQEHATRRLTARPAVRVRLERKSIAFAISLYDTVSLLCATCQFYYSFSFPISRQNRRL
ncbi:hypothetical protein FG382_06185 [Psychrobacillus lasiicapitis]|uniref:Uncharacterized protein n=1 Tax=Psychrobacillus lasiicapitis TaxID=1636719 RepID=A0A544TC76_9BACI|nr:hypothetical protein FG382_06185 [Psychrobacillus lasiicapitis]